MEFELQRLKYSYDALEPHIDKRTMEIHHSKHYAGYTNKLNANIKDTDLEGKTIEEILKTTQHIAAIRNNAGGYYNHNLFWSIMTPNGNTDISNELKKSIEETFGSIEEFKEEFSKVASTQFGSGWAWLYVADGALKIGATPNHDNPIMEIELNGEPILCLDVWEHAYYLNYQNVRPDYINAFFEIINWEEVSKKYDEIVSRT